MRTIHVCTALAAVAGSCVFSLSPAGADTAAEVTQRVLSAKVTANAPAPATVSGPVDQLIVKYEDGVAPRQANGEATGADSVSSAEIWPGEPLGRGIRTVDLSKSLTEAQAKSAAQQLASDPDVEWAVADTKVAIARDARWQWDLDRIDQRSLPLDLDFHSSYTGAGVKAYVVDTGIRATHVEFAGKVLPGANFTNGDVNDTADCNGHGTHVAGTIGGQTSGVAPGVSLVPVRVFPCQAVTTASTIIQGINWIIKDHQAGQPAVANMSLGGGINQALDEATAALVADGVVVAVASANNAADACSVSPARTPQAITVNASTSDDFAASFSNFGPCTDIYAPGKMVLSSINASDFGYQYMSGTSMASPHVAGAAALYLERSPSARPSEIEAALKATATPVNFGHGPTDANRLLYVGNIVQLTPKTVTELTPSVGALAPAFDPNISDYTITLPWSQSTFRFKAGFSGPGATMTYRIEGGEALPINNSSETADIPITSGQTLKVIFTITGGDGMPLDTVVRVTRSTPTFVDLASIKLNSGSLSPAFARQTLSYSASVPFARKSIAVMATRLSGSNVGLQVSVNDSTFRSLTNGAYSADLPLNVGVNRIAVRVRNAVIGNYDYNINVTRQPASSVKTLSALSATPATSSVTFDPNISSYTYSVEGATTKVQISATESDKTSSMSYRIGNSSTWYPTTNSTLSFSQDLAFGDTTVTIRVKAEDGSTNDYVITVSRPLSNQNRLTSLSSSVFAISPRFSQDVANFTAVVPAITSSVTMAANWLSSQGITAAIITPNGQRVGLKQNATSPALALGYGENRFVIQVAAANGDLREYMITITRLSPDVTLKSLTTSSGTLSPVFDKITRNFTVNVPDGTTRMTLEARSTDAQNIVQAFLGTSRIANASGGVSASFAVPIGVSRVEFRVAGLADLSSTTVVSVVRLR